MGVPITQNGKTGKKETIVVNYSYHLYPDHGIKTKGEPDYWNILKRAARFIEADDKYLAEEEVREKEREEQAAKDKVLLDKYQKKVVDKLIKLEEKIKNFMVDINDNDKENIKKIQDKFKDLKQEQGDIKKENWDSELIKLQQNDHDIIRTGKSKIEKVEEDLRVLNEELSEWDRENEKNKTFRQQEENETNIESVERLIEKFKDNNQNINEKKWYRKNEKIIDFELI